MSKYINVKNFIIFSYIISWFSISTTYQDIYDFFYSNEFQINLTINFLRQSANILVFIIILIIFFVKFKTLIFKDEWLFLIFLFYFMLQIPGLIFTENSLINFIYLMSVMNIFLIFFLTNSFFEKKDYFIFFKIIFFMLIIIVLFNHKTFVNFISSKNHTDLYLFFKNQEIFFGKDSPRSTGMSRTLLIIYIISTMIFFNFFKNKSFLKIFIFSLISSLIILFQSRTTIILLIIYIILNYIYENNFSLKYISKYFFKFVILPIVLTVLILFSKELVLNNELKMKLKIHFLNLTSVENNLEQPKIIINKEKFIRPMDPYSATSGRFEDWRQILKEIKKYQFFGAGAQGDRFLINQSASNGMLYSIASSGFLGSIFYFVFTAICFLFAINRFIKNYKFLKIDEFVSISIVMIFLARSIPESSFAVFGIDFIIFYTFMNYLKKFYTKKYDIK